MARVIILVMLMCSFTTIHSKTRFHLNVTPGLSYVPPVPLSILQDNHETLSLWARYESAPLKLPPYYSVRFGFKREEAGWEIEMNHLKIYLKNKPDEVDRFSVSHGYNQILVNRIGKTGKFNSKTGIGLVAAHPENTIRGQTLNEKLGFFNDGYYLTGPVVQYGVFREIPLGNYFYILGEARISAAYARIPVVNGKAHTPVVALHLQIGPGVRY